MSTRAVISFRDDTGMYHVYQHYDGDPESVLENLKNVKHCWPFPRWEANDFAAAYVATYKDGGGNIRLTQSARRHSDLEFKYVVYAHGDYISVHTYTPSGKCLKVDRIPLGEKEQ
jgi:hypothetical protein